MEQANSMSKLSGRVGSLLLVVGLLTYLVGLSGTVPRTVLFVGAAMMLLSFAAFSIEEFGPRR